MIAVFLATLFVGLLIFLSYILINMVFKTKTVANSKDNNVTVIPFRASFDDVRQDNYKSELSNNAKSNVLQKDDEVTPYEPEVDDNQNTPDMHQNIQVSEPEITVNEMPKVVGQTPEDLKAPEPLQEHVNLKVETPSPIDIYDKSDNVALFGSNLRHPEASIERTKMSSFGNLDNEIAAGLASQVTKPNDLDRVQFSAEMAQNGGEFMNGIFAFDSSNEGSYFSSL
jgi:hypothetical protein